MNNKSDKIKYMRDFCDCHECDYCPLSDEECHYNIWKDLSEDELDRVIDFLDECRNCNQSQPEETNKKDVANNQNNKYDSGKPKISLVPTAIIWDIAQVREYGNRKYNSPDGWKTVEPQRYIDALLRHTLAFMRDPHSVDAEKRN